jgi:hypothetical protein
VTRAARWRAQVGRRRPAAEVPRAGCGGRPASADREAARRHDSPAVSRRQPPAMSLPGKSKKKVSQLPHALTCSRCAL